MDQEVQRHPSALCCCQSSWCCSKEEAESHSSRQEPWEKEGDKHSCEDKTQDMGAPLAPTRPAIALQQYLLADGRSMAQTDIHMLGYKISFHIMSSKGWMFAFRAFGENVHELLQHRDTIQKDRIPSRGTWTSWRGGPV